MKLTWTGRTQEWLLDHGIQINEDGKLVIGAYIEVMHLIAE